MATVYEDGPLFQRIKRVYVANAIDDRTSEIQVVMILEALNDDAPSDRWLFCIPPEEAIRLGTILLSGGTTPGTNQTYS